MSATLTTSVLPISTGLFPSSASTATPIDDCGCHLHALSGHVRSAAIAMGSIIAFLMLVILFMWCTRGTDKKKPKKKSKEAMPMRRYN
ncbi:hypothetical protein HBI52_062720 [Parastagonospora nodorum]|nr:hypothetical protein HBH43_013020 [Parastagonospora nodorum]KAH5523372.1 hypothetical protein HBI52_062720 [Parastagonospora nodorum]KAH5707805.1 hypothetical protein HBI20_201840 [Parastagonospora nodorum]